jgi:hypothetical protein
MGFLLFAVRMGVRLSGLMHDAAIQTRDHLLALHC